MSWILAFAGFAALIILHELGHFFAAKAVGMRVERFSLFFGRTPLRFQRGETEYGVGWIPLGGFVKITGMNPQEEIPAEAQPRAYYRQPVWKRLVVISAGPAVNIVLAFVILMVLYWFSIGDRRGQADRSRRAGDAKSPAAAVLQKGDRIITVDGVRGDPDTLRKQIATHKCAGGGEERVQGRRAGQDRDRARRRAAHVRGDARLQRREQAAAARLRLRHRPGAGRAGHRRAAERRPDVVLHDAGP